MKTCSNCGCQSPKDAKVCNVCKSEFSNQSANKGLPIRVIILITFIVVLIIFKVYNAIFAPLFDTYYGIKDNLENRIEYDQDCDNYKHMISFRDSKDILLMDHNVLKNGGANIVQDEKGRLAISLSITDKDKFYEVTNRISQQEDNIIVIWLDYDDSTSFEMEREHCGNGESKCLSAASVSQGFSSDIIIQGNFEREEVEEIVNKINCSAIEK